MWFVAHCRSSREVAARDHLGQQGFGVYLPLTATEPLFPCYLFVHFDPAKKSAATIRSTRGVVGLVQFGGRNAIVPDTLVAALRRGEDANGLHASMENGYEVGELVRMRGGPLEGLLARIAERDSGGRVVLLMEVLGRINRLTVARNAVERA